MESILSVVVYSPVRTTALNQGQDNLKEYWRNNYIYTTVKWKSGDINLPELVGKETSGTWYADFMATALPSSATGIVSMSNFNIVLEYEFESR